MFVIIVQKRLTEHRHNFDRFSGLGFLSLPCKTRNNQRSQDPNNHNHNKNFRKRKPLSPNSANPPSSFARSLPGKYRWPNPAHWSFTFLSLNFTTVSGIRRFIGMGAAPSPVFQIKFDGLIHKKSPGPVCITSCYCLSGYRIHAIIKRDITPGTG